MMKAAAILFCLAPWIVAVATSLLGGIEHREAVRLTSLTFFLLWPVVMLLVCIFWHVRAKS